jgi:hypothetical protein
MNITFITYLAYLAISIAITCWVARTLHRNGAMFLIDVFHGNEALAASVNHLLVVGFYLVNLGFVCWTMRLSYDVVGARGGLEALADKVGMVLLTLGCMHFFNLYVFHKIRRRATLPFMPPPVEPDACTSPA